VRASGWLIRVLGGRWFDGRAPEVMAGNPGHIHRLVNAQRGGSSWREPCNSGGIPSFPAFCLPRSAGAAPAGHLVCYSVSSSLRSLLPARPPACLPCSAGAVPAGHMVCAPPRPRRVHGVSGLGHAGAG
jgi:hypothetical protein